MAFSAPPAPGQSAAEIIDPFALLKSLRAHAEKLTVFCQAGNIAVPHGYQRLYAYLEQSVVQVTPQTKLGVFHPKAWALRFTHPDGGVRYRVLCLSRNLTFDSSWDTALAVDGVLNQDRSRAYAGNHPLGDFFAALPGLAVRPVDERTSRRVDLIADELRRVEFEAPDDFDELAFTPIGIAKHAGMPFSSDKPDGRLIISPFLTDGALQGLPGKGGTLISRIEELDSLRPDTLERFKNVMVLADEADQLEDEPEQEGLPPNASRPPTSGLHAKLYVFDYGWNSAVWTGSANASTAAFEDNVEFQTYLYGKKSRVGVEATLEALRPLLQPYLGKGREMSVDSDEERLERLLRQVRAELARVHWSAHASGGADGLFHVVLSANALPSLPDGAVLSVRPLTLREAAWHPAASKVMFAPCSLEALTSFFVMRLELKLGGAAVADEFVVHAALQGAPENRLASVLDSMLSDPAKVLRFLRLLLAIDSFAILEALEELASENDRTTGANPSSHADEAPLLESMLRALAREPARLEAIGQVIDDLARTEDGLSRLPPGFREAWEPIRAAREHLGGKS